MKQPDLILLHGALGSKEQFASLVPLVEIKGRVHTIDFEGHGQAPDNNRPFSTEHFTESVREYMEEHNLPLVDLFGYSMGGYVALCIARQYPKLVRRVFTFATKFDWSIETADREASLLDPDRIARKTPKFAKMLSKRHINSDWRDVVLKTRRMTLRQGTETMLSKADYQELKNVIRLSMGDRDQMVSIEETLNIYRLLSKGQFQIFPNTPHIIELTPLNLLADAINTFFQ